MSTAPFGAAGFGFPPFDPADWERMARQWFAPAQPPAPRAQGFDPFGWWQSAASPRAPAADPSALASQWMGQIQQLAAQFAGRDAAASDIARAWKAMLGDNPFASGIAPAAFMPMPFFGASGGRGPLDMPAFGYTREHQERMQAFAKTGTEFQQAAQAFQSIIAEAGQDAFSRFESLLAQRTADGKPLESSRALFDLWIDAAEDAYADIALSERFQRAFGEYVNAQMRVRAAMQAEVELACAQWGIPGRGEVDAAHRKIAELQRELRRLRGRLDATSMKPAAAAPEPSLATKPAQVRKPPESTTGASTKPGKARSASTAAKSPKNKNTRTR